MSDDVTGSWIKVGDQYMLTAKGMATVSASIKDFQQAIAELGETISNFEECYGGDNDDPAFHYEDLPGANEMAVHPVYSRDNEDEMAISDIIISLNDYHHWSREQIADWLDKLHDTGAVDLSFKALDESL